MQLQKIFLGRGTGHIFVAQSRKDQAVIGRFGSGTDMSHTEHLYESWAIEGSYFNRMIDCGKSGNHWVEIALGYLPIDILDRHKEDLAFIAVDECDACRLAPQYREREIILLADRIFPKSSESESDHPARYFIFAVLHETAHAIQRHKSPRFDRLTAEEIQAQEAEADQLALEWFNQHVSDSDSQWLSPLESNEIEDAKDRSRLLKEELDRVQIGWHKTGPTSSQ